MARINNLTNFLTDVASAIKAKTGDSSLIPASQFDTKITGIQTGHLDNTEYQEANTNLDNILYQSENVLPDAYQQVEYLESTGTQYINTGVSYANDLLVKDKVLYTVLDDEVSTKTIYRLSGVSATLYWGVCKRGNTSAWTWSAGSITSVPVQTFLKYQLEINMSTNEVYANGDLVGSRSTTSTGTGNMYLFASKNATKDEVNSSEYDIRRYGTEIYKSGILIRNFVPCYRKSDNEAGMYDTVNGVFYTNQGTGDFVVGEDIDILNSKIESVLIEKMAKIKSQNIKSGVNILGITGTYTGSSEGELYPVGTDIVSTYLGRNISNGNGLFKYGTSSKTTGIFTQTDINTDNGICLTYIPINPNYTYYKTEEGRIYNLCYYDENYDFISGVDYNNLSWTQIVNIPINARYIRFATHNSTNNWDIKIMRMI